jgi:hypothetical protein
MVSREMRVAIRPPLMARGIIMGLPWKKYFSTPPMKTSLEMYLNGRERN